MKEAMQQFDRFVKKLNKEFKKLPLTTRRRITVRIEIAVGKNSEKDAGKIIKSNITPSERESKFHNALPVVFSRHDAVETGRKLNISERTVGKYLRSLTDKKLLQKGFKYGEYVKFINS